VYPAPLFYLLSALCKRQTEGLGSSVKEGVVGTGDGSFRVVAVLPLLRLFCNRLLPFFVLWARPAGGKTAVLISCRTSFAFVSSKLKF
jgi:hypothetical protein